MGDKQQALASPLEVIAGTDDVMSININGGGANPATLTAGTYGSILTMIYELDAILTAFDASMYAYLNSDYKVVLVHGGPLDFTLDWTSSTLMRRLGFRANLSGAATYTATDTPGFLWMPPYYSADVSHRTDDTAIIGANAIDGTFSGIALAPGNYVKKHQWQAVAATDVMKSACEASYTYGSVYYPEEERCLEQFTINALTASPTGTEGLSIKGCYYIEDMDDYDGIGNTPASMDGGGHRFQLTSSPDNYIFCHLRPGRWTDPTPTLENHNSLYDVGVELISAVGGVPTWSKP